MVDENLTQETPQEFDQRRVFPESGNLRYTEISAPNGDAEPYVEHQSAPVISQDRGFPRTTTRDKVSFHTMY